MISETVTCIPFVRDLPDPRHDLLRAFRAGDPDAFTEVARAGAPGSRPAGGAPVRTRHDRRRRSRPPGGVGERALRGADPCPRRRVPGPGCRAPGCSIRVRDSAEAKAGNRRDPVAEVATLSWDVRLVPAGVRRVLLVDDVLRSGATLVAAAMAVPSGLAASTIALAVFHATSG